MLCACIGPFVDKIRHMDDPEARNLVMPSAGISIVYLYTCAYSLYVRMFPVVPGLSCVFSDKVDGH